MPRPSPEEKYVSITEVTNTNRGAESNLASERSFVRNYTSTTTPQFPKKKQWNPHYSYTQKRDIVLFSVYEYWDGRPDLGWGDYRWGFLRCGFSGTTVDTVSHDSAFTNSVRNKHMDEILDRRVNLAQAFAERAQTVRLISDTASRLAKCLSHVRRGRLFDAARTLGLNGSRDVWKSSGSIAKDWLSLQYGWKPLLSDVYGSAESLARTHLQRPPRLVVTTKRKLVVPVNEVGSVFSSYPVPCYHNGTITRTVRFTSVYEVSNQFIRDGSQLGITDPLSLAWELLPWSFVIDWFIPIGDFISRLNYDSGLQHLATELSEWSSLNSTLSIGSASNSGPYGTLVRNCSGSASSSAVLLNRRTVDRVTPLLPEFKDPFSLTHALNALALLRAQKR